MNTQLSKVVLGAVVGLAVATAPAASISYSLTAPTPGTYDIYNFVGAANDGANVNDGGVYADGAGNDGFTYVAFDQTFTTGGLLGAYAINAIWMQHAGYTTNADATWYMVPAGSHFQIRITDPSQSGSAGFVLATDVAITTGLEPNSLPVDLTNTPNGTGTWLRFGLQTPLFLAPNTTYGFDVSSPSSYGGFGVQPFFESLGTSSDLLSGGIAYSSGPVGSGGDNSLTGLVGDRVFLVELSPIPEPGTLALLGAGGLAFWLRRRS